MTPERFRDCPAALDWPRCELAQRLGVQRDDRAPMVRRDRTDCRGGRAVTGKCRAAAATRAKAWPDGVKAFIVVMRLKYLVPRKRTFG